jgi:hypothetical protein
MARIEINNLTVDEELTSHETKDVVGGVSLLLPAVQFVPTVDSEDLGGSYSLNYSDLSFTIKVDKASPKLF